MPKLDTRFRCFVKKADGILFNPSFESGSLGAIPYLWIQGGDFVAPNPPVRVVKGVASGGWMGSRQTEIAVSSGAQFDAWNIVPDYQKAYYASGDTLEYDLRYRVPSGTTAGDFFVARVLASAFPGASVWQYLVRESGSTINASSGTEGWKTARGSFLCGRTSGTSPVVSLRIGVEVSGSSPDANGNYADGNFTGFVDFAQLYRVVTLDAQDILSYSYRKGTGFGASVAEISLRNQAGKYTSGGALVYGDELRFQEGIMLSDGSWYDTEVFRGIIREFRPTNEGGVNRIVLTAYDPLIKLQDSDLSNLWTGEKQNAKHDFFYPNALSGSVPTILSGDFRASVWDASQGNWATYPPAVISTYPTYFAVSNRRDPLPDGFELYPIPGQILFGKPLSFRNVAVEGNYTFYLEPIHAEDLLLEVLASGDGFGNRLFDPDSDLRESYSNLHSGVDVLTANTAADTLPSRFRVESAGWQDGDYARLMIDGVDYSPNSGNAFNVLNVTSGGTVLASRAYSTEIAAHIASMANDFDSVFPSGTYVLLASRGTCYSPHLSGTHITSMGNLGARFTRKISSGTTYGESRYQSGSYAFIGQVGKAPLSGVIPEILHASTEGAVKTSQTIYGTYGVSRIWSTTYDNWITGLSGGDLSMPSTVAVEKILPRIGAFVLSGAAAASAVQLTGDYDFRTIQATGIELTEFEATFRDGTRFDVIQNLMTVVPPNYFLYSDKGKIWGKFFQQKTSADFVLNLTEAYEVTGDEDVYTRVQIYGKSQNPTNLSLRPETQFITAPQSLSGSVADLELSLGVSDIPGYRLYQSPLSGTGRILSDPYPVVNVNGSPIITGRQQVVGGGVLIRTEQETKV